MKLYPQDLKKITNLTLEDYNQRAEDFWEGTREFLLPDCRRLSFVAGAYFGLVPVD